MTNETDKHEQALPARDELKGLVVEQTRVLERLAKTFAPDEEVTSAGRAGTAPVSSSASSGTDSKDYTEQ